ncbi:MAG: hypothetical protein ACI906_003152 [Candidatus Latescibacterota bacterium]|jgi:hypothetical protein
MLELKKYFSTAIWVLGLVWVGCHNPDDFAFNSDESPQADRFLSLSAVGDTTLPADGFSALELVAHVSDVSEGPLAIQFTTTAGSLRVGTRVGTLAEIDSVNSAVRTDSVVVQTNASGEARVELVGEAQQTTALVRARIVGLEPIVEQEIRIHFNSVADEEILAFVDPAESAFAHGLALVPFMVQISSELEGDERDVRFETTNGIFPLSNDSSRVQIVRADAAGMATAYLRSPEQVGEALVRATIMTFFQERVIRFVSAPTDSVLHFVEVPEEAMADGQSLSRFSVEISPHLQLDSDRTVEFTTTSGSFVLSDDTGSTVSVRANADGVATAFLRSPSQYEEAFVQASVKGFVQQEVLQFGWAGPDSILVSSERNQQSLAANEQLQIEAELIRLDGRGLVTENLPVSFAAFDSLGNPLASARFVNVTRTDVEGMASAVFVVSDTLYQGKASISVRSARITSEVVGQVELTILPR